MINARDMAIPTANPMANIVQVGDKITSRGQASDLFDARRQV
jgi:hypothetical protein